MADHDPEPTNPGALPPSLAQVAAWLREDAVLRELGALRAQGEANRAALAPVVELAGQQLSLRDCLIDALHAEVGHARIGTARVGTIIIVAGIGVATAAALLVLLWFADVPPLDAVAEARRWYAGECVAPSGPSPLPAGVQE
jgi:hypothetical protein